MNGRPFVFIHSRVAEFGKLECEYYPRENRHAFSLTVSQVQRYEFFLRMILRRYDETATDFGGAVMRLQAHRTTLLKSGPGPYAVTTDESEIIGEIDNLSPYIQLDSESFYMFAKVLLDRISKFLEDYFRPSHTDRLARGYTFEGSHHTLLKKFEAFAELRKLTIPAGFMPLVRELQEKVSDFRDDHITHNHNMRTMHATAFSVDGSGLPRMMKAPMLSKDWNVGGRQVESIAVHELMARLDAYFDAVFALVIFNREHSAFMRAAPQPAT